MYEFVKNLTNNWKEIIESIDVNGETRKVKSIELFEMKYYYDNDKTCYKVVFNFLDGFNIDSKKITEEWHKQLESIFFNMFYDSNFLLTDSEISDTKGYYNTKVDYTTNQGYRFIIQFYPNEFLSDFRNEKIKSLGI